MLPAQASPHIARWRSVIATTAGMLLLLAGCGTTDQPRWTTAIATSDAEAGSFESPRTMYVVASDPGDAAVELRGNVRATEFVEVLAPADGVLTDLVVNRGDAVTVGEIIVEAETTPTEAELVAVEILQLEVDLAVAQGRPESEIASAQQAVDNARSELAPVPFFIEATASGVIGLPSASGRTLVQGEPVVLIANPSSLVVEVELSPEQRAGINEGAIVTIAASTGANTQTETVTIDRIIEPDDPNGPTTLSIPISGDTLTLGEGVNAVVSIVATPDAAWLPSEAVGRRDGASFVLVAGDDGLMAMPVVLGRRAGALVELLVGPPAGATVVGPG